VEPTPEFQEWIEQNSWADPNSHQYDLEMFETADNYSLLLMRKYQRQGRENEIGTSKFFDEITDFVKNSYDIDIPSAPVKTQSKDRMQMKTDKSPPVGPVNRQSIQSQEAPRKPNDINLTPEQKEIAHSLKGHVRDPKTGQKIMDSKTLEEIYKRNLMRGTG
jgi:hypothetical protein